MPPTFRGRPVGARMLLFEPQSGTSKSSNGETLPRRLGLSVPCNSLQVINHESAAALADFSEKAKDLQRRAEKPVRFLVHSVKQVRSDIDDVRSDYSARTNASAERSN